MAAYGFPSQLTSSPDPHQMVVEGQGQHHQRGSPASTNGMQMAQDGGPELSTQGTYSNVITPDEALVNGAGAQSVSPPIEKTALPSASPMPAMDFNGYTLYASGKHVPEELMRQATGASIAEPGSVLDEESGRTYHNHRSGGYFFPNDPAEQDRLDLQHKMWTVLIDHNLHRSPVASPKNVLDIATGTGIWAIQFAKLHPESNVIGTDLSLIQPDNVPSNVSFIKENSEKDEWVFSESFDFVHLRAVLTCFDHHRAVIQKVFDNLNPGGWIEFNDPTFELLCTDGTTKGTGIKRWSDLLLQAGPMVGRDFLVAKNYKQWLLDIGFVDVVEEVLPCPINYWPSDPKFQDVGRWQMLNMEKGLRGGAWKLFRSLGLSPEEIEDIVRLAKADLRNTSIHGFFPIYVVYGRKPFAGERVEGGLAQECPMTI